MKEWTQAAWASTESSRVGAKRQPGEPGAGALGADRIVEREAGPDRPFIKCNEELTGSNQTIYH